MAPIYFVDRELVVVELTMANIPLTMGQAAVVDDADFGRLREIRWAYLENYKRPGNGCAVHWVARGLYLTMANLVLGVEGIVDHINGDRLDNRRSNLRACSAAQNGKNRSPHKRSAHPELASYKGVYFDGSRKRPYRVQIMCDGRSYHGGSHATPELAALAYNALAIELHGEFARLNNIINVGT